MVEWKKLEEVCTPLNKSIIRQGDLLDNGCYPVVNSGISLYGKFNQYNNEGNAFTLASRGEYAGYITFLSGRFWAGGLCYPYRSNNENILITKYIYQYLKRKERFIMDTLVMRGGIPALNKADVDKILIPIPSLSEQQKIVGILDTFTSAIDNLKEQIAQRRKQYEYYRDQLLDLEGKEGVEMKTLGDACEIRRGIRVVKKQLKENDRYPVFQNSIAPMGYYDQFNRDGDMPYIICAGSSSGSVGYCYTPFWAADDCFTIESSKVNRRYAYYALKKYNNNLFKLVRKGSMPRLPHEAIDNMVIPIPSLSEQQRIVSILDTFEASVANLEQQLAQREKQYEYYRNKLLTFE